MGFIRAFLEKIGLGTVWLFEFIFSRNPFTLLGILAFSITFAEGIFKAVEITQSYPTQTQYILHIILNSLLQTGLIMVSADNKVYLLSREFNAIAIPTLFEILKYLFLIIKNLFFYVMWFKVFAFIFKNAGKTLGTGTDMGVGIIDLTRIVLPYYLGFFMVMNVFGMYGMGILKMPENTGIWYQNIKAFLDLNFESAFDFIWKLFPFKGLFHFIIFSIGKMMKLFDHV